ncbi:hypothetical protein GB881_15395, partial [Georgenia subflava]
DGDGIDTLAVRRGREYHVKNSISTGIADHVVAYGRPDDAVLVGDWDGDGIDTFTVRRGSTYHVKNSIAAGTADQVAVYGRATDTVLVGDWDGRRRNYNRADINPPVEVTPTGASELSRLSPGWANNSVNTTAFRKSSITSIEAPDGRLMQYTAYYDPMGTLVLARRDRGAGAWEYEWTQYTGDVTDAHNSISIAVDGAGYLHVAWGHHVSRLNYARSAAPWSLELGRKQSMVGSGEASVTYPEFFRKPDGDLFFLYRDGTSGDGKVVLNNYDTDRRRWTRVHDNLIDGRDGRTTHSAYWQGVVDSLGRLHLSWTWRETPNVATNHDIAYARSTSATGRTWERSTGVDYKRLPITKATDDVVVEVPKYRELMNQTSMAVDDDNNPFIASYWTPDGSDVPQYHVVHPTVEPEPEPEPTEKPTEEPTAEPTQEPTAEPTAEPTEEPTAEPTEEPTDEPTAEPTAQPSVDPTENLTEEPADEETDAPTEAPTLEDPTVDTADAPVVERATVTTAAHRVATVAETDEPWTTINTGIRETPFTLSGAGTKALPIARPQILVSGSGATATVHLIIRDVDFGGTAALASLHGLHSGEWDVTSLTVDSLGEWEPSYDLDLWREHGLLDVFVQNVKQIDGEGLADYPSQFVYVMQVDRTLAGS